MRKPGINELFITKLKYCHSIIIFFYVLLSSHYIHALLTYKRCCNIKINSSVGTTVVNNSILLSLIKFPVGYDFISFLILKMVLF